MCRPLCPELACECSKWQRYQGECVSALTALEASGMAVVGWRFDMENAPKSDCLRFEPAEYRRGKLSLAARVVISNGAYPRQATAWMPLPAPPASPTPSMTENADEHDDVGN